METALGAVEVRRLMTLPKLDWEDAHADQVAAVDAFEALRDDARTPSNACYFAAQSRLDPAP